MKIEAANAPTMAPTKTLSHGEIQALKAEEQKLQDIKDGVELRQGVKYEADDLKAVEDKLNRIRKIRQEGEAPDLSSNERTFLEQKAKMIQEHMHRINPTFKEFQDSRPSDGPRYSRLVQQLTRNMVDKEYQGMVREWQDCRRKLHPEDAYAADTRQLYKE